MLDTVSDAEKKAALIKFEEEIADIFTAGKIRAPVHLSDGNEDVLIDIFKNIKSDDWVFSTHRSHYHALLHGIDPGWLREEIVRGNSISICNPKHSFYSSGIVGGIHTNRTRRCHGFETETGSAACLGICWGYGRRRRNFPRMRKICRAERLADHFHR